MKILLLESEVRTAQYLRQGLVENGFAVDVMGLESAAPHASHYDLLVCDVDSGKNPAPDVRLVQQPPVLFLAKRDAIPQRRAGTGDCLLKPFVFTEFLARVRGLLSSRTDSRPTTLRIAGLELDLLRHHASRDTKRLDLTPKEFLLLSLLMRKSGEVLSRAYIADQVWDINFESNTNFIDVNIRRLRSKVDAPFPEKLIHTVRGIGYVLEDRS